MLPEAHLPIAFLSFLDGLEPIQTLRKHRISAYFQFRAVRSWSPTLVTHTLVAACRSACTELHLTAKVQVAVLCTVLLRHDVRAAQVAPSSRRDWWHLASRCCIVRTPGRARASAPLPTASEGPGAQPTLAQAPAFSEHGLETDAINKGFFTVHSAMGRRPPLCFTVHSVMGRRPTLSTQ